MGQSYKNKISQEDIERHRREHFLQYLLLVIIFIFSVVTLIQLTGTFMKIVAITSIAVVYLLWGVLHHHEEKNFTKDHLLEYLMISILIFLILVFIFVPI